NCDQLPPTWVGGSAYGYDGLPSGYVPTVKMIGAFLGGHLRPARSRNFPATTTERMDGLRLGTFSNHFPEHLHLRRLCHGGQLVTIEVVEGQRLALTTFSNLYLYHIEIPPVCVR